MLCSAIQGFCSEEDNPIPSLLTAGTTLLERIAKNQQEYSRRMIAKVRHPVYFHKICRVGGNNEIFALLIVEVLYIFYMPCTFFLHTQIFS